MPGSKEIVPSDKHIVVTPKMKEKATRFFDLIKKFGSIENPALQTPGSVPDKTMDTFFADGFDEDDLDNLNDSFELILGFASFIPPGASPKDIPLDILASMDKISFKESIGPALQHFAEDPQFVKMIFALGTLLSRWIDPPRRKLTSIMKLTIHPKNKSSTKFNRALVSRFLKALEIAENKDFKRTNLLIETIDRKKVEMLGAHTWWDSSQYRRLGMEQKNPSLKQVFEAIFKKDEILFDLPEEEIRTIVIRLCKDYASAIEEHLKLILATVVNLNRIGLGEELVPFDYELGFYTSELHIARTWNELDLLDFRNVNTHRIPGVTQINKTTKELTILFTLSGHDPQGLELPSRTYTYSWKAFLNEFKRFISLSSLFDQYFDVLYAEIERDGKEPDDERPRRLEQIKNDPALAREYVKRLGLAIQYSTMPTRTPEQEAEMWLNQATLSKILGEYQAAESDFHRAIAAKPDSPVPYANFAVFYMQIPARDLCKAREYLERAQEIAPEDANVLYNLACINSLENNPDKALSLLQAATGKESKYRTSASTDHDFDAIRDSPRFQRLIASPDTLNPPKTEHHDQTKV